MLLLLCALLVAGSHGQSRPSSQSSIQKEVFKKWAAEAKILSPKAQPAILAELGSKEFRKAISSLPHDITSKNDTELLNIMYYEISLAPLIHNVPLTYGASILSSMAAKQRQMDEKAVSDDRFTSQYSREAHRLGATWDQVEALGYLPNVWEQIAAGAVPWNVKYEKLDNTEKVLLGFPSMNLPPNTSTSRDRPIYLSVNLWKKCGGNLEYGPIGLVLDRVHASNVTFIAPVDTGHYARYCLESSPVPNCTFWKPTTYGTLDDLWHLVFPHLNFWGLRFSDLFYRWYGGMELPKGYLMYMEAELAGSFLVPEFLQYVTVDFQYFSTTTGRNLQQWCMDLKRPLGWIHNFSSGTVLDAWVGQMDGIYEITDHDRSTLQEFWRSSSKVSWDKFKNTIDNGLHLHYLDGLNHYKCYRGKCEKCKFIGVNSYGQCMYWDH